LLEALKPNGGTVLKTSLTDEDETRGAWGASGQGRRGRQLV